MKTKKLTLLLCTLCFFLAVFTLPAAAKSKSIPKKLFLSRKEILLYVGESKNLWVEKSTSCKSFPKSHLEIQKAKNSFCIKKRESYCEKTRQNYNYRRLQAESLRQICSSYNR